MLFFVLHMQGFPQNSLNIDGDVCLSFKQAGLKGTWCLPPVNSLFCFCEDRLMLGALAPVPALGAVEVLALLMSSACM